MDNQFTADTLNCCVTNDLNIPNSADAGTIQFNNITTCWDYWQGYHYPEVVTPSYPVYLQERALDKGKQAFEIIKILKDKKLVKIDKVSNFIDLMDELIKIL